MGYVNYVKYEQAAINCMEQIIKQYGKKPMIIYPFGERGKMLKSIMNTYFNIQETLIIDNLLANKYPLTIKPLCVLNDESFKTALVLITSDTPLYFDAIREPLYKIVEKERCIEVFKEIIEADRFLQKNEKELFEEAEERKNKVFKKLQIENIELNRMCYMPKNTQSVFYLPYIYMDYIQQVIYLTDDYYEKELLDNIFIKFSNGIISKSVIGNTVIDIGANIGNHTLYFANEAKAGKVISYEPIVETYRILRRNIEINNLENKVICFCCALGEKSIKAKPERYAYNNIGYTPLKEDRNGSIEVKTLDSFLIEGKVALIKIDVENMELPVLNGAINLISKWRPYIIIETWEWENGIGPIKNLLSSMGYRWQQLNNNNWLFYHKE